jgi:hypothetical protein
VILAAPESNMSTDAAIELIKLLAPTGSAAIVAVVVAYRSPQLVKELFAGVNGLLLTVEKIRKERTAHKSTDRVERKNVGPRSSRSRSESTSLAA